MFILYLVACCCIEYSEKPLLAAVVVTFVQVTSLLRKKASSGKYTGFVISKNLTYYIKKDNIYCLVTLISDQYVCHLHEKNLWVLLADSGFNTIIPQTLQ